MDTKFRRIFKLTFVLILSIFGLIFSDNAAAHGLASSNGVDLIRGAWGGTINFPSVEAQINLYFREFGPDPLDPNVAVSSGFLSFSIPDHQKRAKALMTPMQARYVDLGGGEFDITVVGTLITPQGDSRTIRLTGKIQTFGSGVTDDIFNGNWHMGNASGPWSAKHLDRRKISAPEINLGDDLYFRVDVYSALHGPAGYPQTRNPYTLLEVYTNIVFANVRVDISGGESVLISPYTDVFSPDVDFINEFRFIGSIAGLAINGGIYTFVALDILGNPIAGVMNTDVYVGGNEPDPPSNVSATVTSDGIQVTWAPVAEIPGSFQPGASPPLGFYQIELGEVGGGEILFGANLIHETSHLIPKSKFNFLPNDYGFSLNELGNGIYRFSVISLSIAPNGSVGKGIECQSRDSDESVTFQIEDGIISILF